MNKRLIGFTSVIFGIVCMGSPCQAQDAKASEVASLSKAALPLGQFKITPSQSKDSVVIEANEAPVIPLLQAIVQQTHRKVIISDEAEAQAKRKKVTISTYRPVEMTVDRAFDVFSGNSLSWGKVGQDTYLVVPRQESPAEAAARKAETDRILESLNQKRKEEPKQDPEQAPWNGRFWLLKSSQQ